MTGAGRFRTWLALGRSDVDRADLVEVYQKFESRAVWLMSGWQNVMGTTPDDLAQVALCSYLSLLPTHDPDEAHKLASRGLQQDVYHLFAKGANNPTGYFADAMPADPDDPHSEPGEHSLAAVEASWLYFTPDFVDALYEHLTGREIDLLIQVYEQDRSQAEIARSKRVSTQAVTKRVRTALNKLRDGGFQDPGLSLSKRPGIST